MEETLGDVARKLGEKLLAREQLTHSQVQAAVEVARIESKAVAARTRLERLASEFRFIVRLKDKDLLRAGLTRVVSEIQEVIGEISEQ